MERTHFESLYPADSRSDEIDKIIAYIKQGNSCQVIALPGVGRSTILGLLAYNKAVRVKHLGDQETNFHFVLTNFSEVRRRPLLDVTKFLFLSLVDSLRERQFDDAYHKANSIFKEALELNDELVLFQGLKNAIDVLAVEKNLTVVFLFDRFEEYIPMITPDFFANLRVLRNRAKYQFSVIFSLNRPLEESIEPSFMTEYYDFVVGHTVYLPIVDKPGLEFRIKHIAQSTGKTLSSELHEQILTLTGGFAREVKVCLQAIAMHDYPDFSSPKELGTFLLSQKTVQRPLFELWQALTPSEQSFLMSGVFDMEDPDYTYLANVGLLTNGKISIPIFSLFLQEYLIGMSGEQKKREQIIHDQNTGEIKQGTTIISDSLTSSEYKLLRFLIQNTERILDREEIINRVWGDAVSTAGVTDQALDQLIFRLRKKIEADPANPYHLQTVKGRGYKFLV